MATDQDTERDIKLKLTDLKRSSNMNVYMNDHKAIYNGHLRVNTRLLITSLIFFYYQQGLASVYS